MGDRRDKFESLLTRLLETNNKAEFTHKFTADRRKILPYIFAMDTFIRIQNITDQTIAFRRIIKSLDNGHRDLFMSDHIDEDQLTVDMLKTWLLNKYPPPPMKHEWIIKLKQIRMRKNEDPLLVYQKFLAILGKVDQAITYLNADLDEESSKRIPKISDELKHEILLGIFIRNNNEARCNNMGQINRETRKFVARKDPSAYKDWKPIFVAMELELIPRCYQTLPEYQYQTYDFCPNEYDIYLSPKKKQSKQDDHSSRKRKHDNPHYDKTPPHKRQKKGTCRKCGKEGHHAFECRTKQNKGNPKPRPKLYCNRCKRNNHSTRECRATRYSDGAPINDEKSDRIRDDYRSRRRDDRRDRYHSKRGRDTDRSRSRDRDISRKGSKFRNDDRSRDRTRSRDDSRDRSRGRWGDKDKRREKNNSSSKKPYHRTLAALSKNINDDLDLDAEQSEKMQEYLAKIAEISARQSQSPQ